MSHSIVAPAEGEGGWFAAARFSRVSVARGERGVATDCAQGAAHTPGKSKEPTPTAVPTRQNKGQGHRVGTAVLFTVTLGRADVAKSLTFGAWSQIQGGAGSGPVILPLCWATVFVKDGDRGERECTQPGANGVGNGRP
jgi:hypothetical protein